MKTKSQIRRTLVISTIVIIFTAFSFMRLTGIENIRAIHIITLLTCGMGIGVFLTNLILYLRKTE